MARIIQNTDIEKVEITQRRRLQLVIFTRQHFNHVTKKFALEKGISGTFIYTIREIYCASQSTLKILYRRFLGDFFYLSWHSALTLTDKLC